MTHPTSQEVPSVKEIRFDASGSREIVHDIAAAQESGGVNVVFVGANREAMQEAVNQLADYTGHNVHRINVAGLIGDRDNQTRGNVREAFDNAADSLAILVFDSSGEMFAEVARHRDSGELDEDSRTAIDYLFQRIKAFKGICVLQLSDETHLEDVFEPDMHFIVRF